jgi:hypothetical protein
MIGKEKGNLLIQVTAWAGLIVLKCINHYGWLKSSLQVTITGELKKICPIHGQAAAKYR